MRVLLVVRTFVADNKSDRWLRRSQQLDVFADLQTWAFSIDARAGETIEKRTFSYPVTITS